MDFANAVSLNPVERRGTLTAPVGAPGIAGEVMGQLWFEEADKRVWHLMTRRTGPMDYHAACGWHLTPHTGRVWPQKPLEDGPARERRCRTCVGEGYGASQ